MESNLNVNTEKSISSLDLTFSFSKAEKKRRKKDLQRTEKWRKKRLGRWTSSQLKQLMSSLPGKSKLNWSNLDRVFSFGKTALKYIYENAMERKTQRYIDDREGTYDMRYGTRVEPLIEAIVKKKLKKKGKFKRVGFKKFDKIPNAGVSSDGIIVSRDNNKKVLHTVEMKACTSWQTHYERTFDLTDESSKDFWQMVGHCEAYNVKTCYYAVAQPPSDIKKYLFYEGDIMDLLEEFEKECSVSIEKVKISNLHKEALLKRIAIAEDTLNDWLAMGGSLKNTLDEVIKMYENNPKKFNDYIPPISTDKKNTNKETLKKKVKLYLWSDQEKSWLLRVKEDKGSGFSAKKFFPKSLCSLEKINEEEGVLTVPKYLFNKIMK